MKNCIFGLLSFKCETSRSKFLYENIERHIFLKICKKVNGDCNKCEFFVDTCNWDNCSKEKILSKIQSQIYLEGIQDLIVRFKSRDL